MRSNGTKIPKNGGYQQWRIRESLKREDSRIWKIAGENPGFRFLYLWNWRLWLGKKKWRLKGIEIGLKSRAPGVSVEKW